jgi:hypothetical protein
MFLHYAKEVNKWQMANKNFFQLFSNPFNYVYYVILTSILMYNIIY